jgi:putative hemolysin
MLNAKSFTYASTDHSIWQRSFIKTIEKLTGQLKIWRLYREYQNETDQYSDFWEAAIKKLDVTVQYDLNMLQSIPQTGSVVIVANHPYGVLDGLIINNLISRVRSDYKVLTNSVLCQAPECKDTLLPIDFGTSREALQTNLDTRKKAQSILNRGGCIVVFPAGGVSSIPTWKDKVAQDTAWQPFIAKLVIRSRATVVPVFFEGQNSRLFQIASLISPTLRLALFFKEVSDKIGAKIGVRVGKAIAFSEIAHIENREMLCHELRNRTYKLGGMETMPPPKAAYRIDITQKKK